MVKIKLFLISLNIKVGLLELELKPKPSPPPPFFYGSGSSHKGRLRLHNTAFLTNCFLDLEEKSKAISAIEEEKSSIATNLQTNQFILGKLHWISGYS